MSLRYYAPTYGLSDVGIVPAPQTGIRHRFECNPYTEICMRKSLPVFVAPMAAVTNEYNYEKWIENEFTPVIPRSVMTRMSFEERFDLSKKTFVSFSLEEAESILNYSPSDVNGKHYICIDIANGHMKALHELCEKLYNKFGSFIETMTGNIANPDVYPYLVKSHVNWIRVNIGTGSRCTTTNTTGIAYGTASLIDELANIRVKVAKDPSFFGYILPKIIVDGGISWYDDINKSLALGADAVMIGKLFAECKEACGKILYSRSVEDFELGIGYHEDELYGIDNIDELKPYRNYAGMSHRSMQIITGGDGSKVSEGIVRPVEVKYTASQLSENIRTYLKSSMSYTYSRTLEQFQNHTTLVVMGGGGLNRYIK